MKKIALIVLAIILLQQFTELAREHSAGTLFLWAGLPATAWLLGPGPMKGWLTTQGMLQTGRALVGLSVGLALFFFANFDHYRDQFGNDHIAGYEVAYESGQDDFGRMQTDAVVRTNSFLADLLLWAGEILFLAAAISLPLLTWKAVNMFLFCPPRS